MSIVPVGDRISDDPVFFQALLDCYNHLDAYGAIEMLCASKIGLQYRNGRVYHPASAKALPGNLGTCALIALESRTIISNTLIAPSFAIANEVRAYQKEQYFDEGRELDCRIATKLVLEDGSDSKNIWINHGVDFNKGTLVSEGMPCPDVGRSSDSEHVLLNVVDAALLVGSLPEDLLVVIATERVPCDTCTNTIIKFLTRHSRTFVAIGYTYDTQGLKPADARQEREFIDQVLTFAVASRVHLQRVFSDGPGIHSFQTELCI